MVDSSDAKSPELGEIIEMIKQLIEQTDEKIRQETRIVEYVNKTSD